MTGRLVSESAERRVARSFGSGRKQKAAPVETMKALAVNRPYAHMLGLGLLKVGGMQAKTRNQPWSYRGPLLIYTNAKPAHMVPIDAYGFNMRELPTGVIACVANLVDVRLLTDSEKRQLFKGYNRAHTNAQIARALDGPHIFAMDYGYFFDKVQSLEAPVELECWPSGGPIANVPLTRQLRLALPAWAVSVVLAKASAKWNTTEPPKEQGKSIRLRYRDRFNNVRQGKFYWDRFENAFLEECEGPDGIGLYESDGFKVVGWR